MSAQEQYEAHVRGCTVCKPPNEVCEAGMDLLFTVWMDERFGEAQEEGA